MKRIMGIILFLTITSCSKEITKPKNYSYLIPADIGDGISVKDIHNYNIDSNKFNDLSKDLIDEKIYNVHSVLVYKDGALFYEKYLYGKDEKHGKNLGTIKHELNTLHDVRSISKSVVSACIGIAISEGLIKDENESIEKYFPHLYSGNNGKEKITIKNLLTMSSGLCWEEIGNYNGLLNDETKMDISFNPIAFVLNKKLVSEPGTIWNYSGGNTQLLADIIYKVSGKNICKFASENLFNPLGINNKEWVNLTIKKIPAAASGLRLTSRDLLKFGIIYLNNGLYNNNQIIDSIWVKNSITQQMQRPDLTHLNIESGGYGFQFWTYNFNLKNKPIKVVEAKGNGGQSIFISKELNLVVVITAGNYGILQYNSIPNKIFTEYILDSML